MKKKAACLILANTIALIFIRAKALDIGYDFPFLGFSVIKTVLLLSFQDILYTVCSGLVILLILYFFRKYKKVRDLIFFLFVLGAMFNILMGLVNVQVINNLNAPLTYKLIKQADFTHSDYIFHLISLEAYKVLFLQFSIITLGCLLVAWLLFVGLRRFQGEKAFKIVCLGAGIVVIAFLYKGWHYTKHVEENDDYTYLRTINPEMYLAASFNFANQTKDVFSANAAKAREDFASSSKNKRIAHVSTNAPTDPRIKNVVILVLESASASYFSHYGTIGDTITPNLRKYQEESVTFSNIYAASPNSTNTLFSLLGSVYPLVSKGDSNIIADSPEFPWPTLSSVLSEQGYKTGFFCSTDNTYSRVNEYLKYRKFN